MARDPYAKSLIVERELMERLSIVPRLAAQHGKGFTLLDGGEIKYFPVRDLPRIPSRFGDALNRYDPSKQVLLLGDRNLSRCPWMLLTVSGH
ncbi:hypothetical protein LEP3755_43160 [Leptolyngbya sp. NIES-3755]|nr:hypothetical protein LEP3755_43160 [Leptolyngbya sp. NIES-3755]